MAKIEINDPKFEKPISYYMDDRLKHNLDEKVIKTLQKKDKDFFLAIDGREGSGKSTLALQIGKFVDPTLNLSRVVFNAEDFRRVIYDAKKGQCVIFDEAFTGLSSRASLSGINKTLIGLMMQMRQKNLFVIIVLPTFFLLDKYVAIFRANVLIHVYETGGNRGYFRLYNYRLKKYLYLIGKPLYSYAPSKIRTRFKGRFYGVFALGGEKEEVKYRKKKVKALEDTEKNPMSAGQVKYREQRDIILYLLRKETKMTYHMLSNTLGDYDLEMSYAQISNICARFGDKQDKKRNISQSSDEILPDNEKEKDLDLKGNKKDDFD